MRRRTGNLGSSSSAAGPTLKPKATFEKPLNLTPETRGPVSISERARGDAPIGKFRTASELEPKWAFPLVVLRQYLRA